MLIIRLAGVFIGTLVTLIAVQFIIGNIVICLNEPVSLGSAVSLFSKLLHPQVQGVVYWCVYMPLHLRFFQQVLVMALGDL